MIMRTMVKSSLALSSSKMPFGGIRAGIPNTGSRDPPKF